MLKKPILFLLTVCAFQFSFAQQNLLTNFPKGSTPQEIGKRLAYHFIGGKHDLYDRYIHYAEVCAWNGALDYALKTKDKQLIEQLINRFEKLFNREKELLPPMNHVDYNMFGSMTLKLYQIIEDKRNTTMGKA